MNSGTVVEITSTEYNPINIFFLAAAKGLDYLQIKPRKAKIRPETVTDMKHVNFSCDLDHLSVLLRSVR